MLGGGGGGGGEGVGRGDLILTMWCCVGLMELQMIGNCFSLLLNAVLLHKCIQARYDICYNIIALCNLVNRT